MGQVALIAGLQPILTAWLAKPLFGEQVTPRQWTGMLLGFIGVALVVSSKAGTEVARPIGLAFSGLALLGITAGTLYQKRFCGGMDLRSGGVIQFASSGVVFWLCALALESRNIASTGEFIFALSWLTLVLSLGAISLLYLLIRRGAGGQGGEPVFPHASGDRRDGLHAVQRKAHPARAGRHGGRGSRRSSGATRPLTGRRSKMAFLRP